jgi:3-hydroxyisobutyrate dehydrogenase-like beta-hydroxyacid dehydrogenase
MERGTVGFIGLGLMGHGMAKNIVEKGWPLLVMGHRNRAPVEDLVARGAREVKTPREMAQASDFIVLCVSASPQVESLIRGPDGIKAGGRPGLTVIDSSTSDPVSTAALHAELAEVGITLVDAPLNRTPKEAEAGTLDCMIGAEGEVLERIRPLVECWATTLIPLGAVGNGHKLKLLNNFIGMSYAALFSEALAIGKRAGISPADFHAVVGAGRMRSGFYDTFMQYAIDRDPNAHRFTLQNAHKDMRYVLNMATEAGAASFLAATVKNYLASAEAMGKGQDYLPTLSDHIAALNGVTLADEPAG